MITLQDQERLLVVYRPLAEAALREGYVGEFWIREIAMTMKTSPGAIRIPKNALVETLMSTGMWASRAHIRKLLERGHGIFWRLSSENVWLLGTSQVAIALDASGVSPERQRVSAKQLLTTKTRRAALLGAALATRAPESQRSVWRRTGVSPRTQRRYRRDGHFGVERQVADITEAASDWNMPLVTPLLRRAAARDLAARGVFVRGHDARLMKRLPNLHLPKGERLPPGRRSRELFAARSLENIAKGNGTVPRVFFESPLRWSRYRRPKMGTRQSAPWATALNMAYCRGKEGWIGVSI